jgi:hypothetical protein
MSVRFYKGTAWGVPAATAGEDEHAAGAGLHAQSGWPAVSRYTSCYRDLRPRSYEIAGGAGSPRPLTRCVSTDLRGWWP